MREIKFRGKRKDNSEWACGYLVVHPGSAFILDTGYLIQNGDFYAPPKWWAQVDPATVGQWTGLKDKNGKDIYEGDVVILTRRIAPYYGCPEEDMKTVYTTTKAIFDSGSFWLTGDGFSGNCHFHYNAEDREIIGNIHDNPELLAKTVAEAKEGKTGRADVLEVTLWADG